MANRPYKYVADPRASAIQLLVIGWRAIEEAIVQAERAGDRRLVKSLRAMKARAVRG